MTIKAALLFLVHARTVPLDDQVTDLQAVVEAGREAGFTFTADELRTAYRQDWGLRWLRRRMLEASSTDKPSS